MKKDQFNTQRRNFIKGLSACTIASCASLQGTTTRAQSNDMITQQDRDRKLLFVFGARGGASMVDAFLPVTESDVDDPSIIASHNIYADSQVGEVDGSAFKYVNTPKGVVTASTARIRVDYELREFLEKHTTDMAVVCASASSVTHSIAQERSVTGNSINGGLTITEAAARKYGEGLLIPNVNFSNGAMIRLGEAPDMERIARAETVGDPSNYSLALHSTRGIDNLPDQATLDHARTVREELEDSSVFAATFEDSDIRNNYLYSRRELQPQMEMANLIETLSLQPSGTLTGVNDSPLRETLLSHFPKMDSDHNQAQAALSVALTHFGVTASVGFGTSLANKVEDGAFTSAPLGFDFSHTAHRGTQAAMWSITCKAVDGVISALKELDYMGNPELGKMWDRSVVYVATDFGREQTRPPGMPADWGSGHSLRNANMILSPMINGNRLFGGVDVTTCETYGFDTLTGAPDANVQLTEGHLYSAVAQALDIDFPGRHNMSALIKS